MNIDEAIKILEKEQRDHHSFSTDIIGQASRLGIEALKRLKEARQRHKGWFSRPLPDETIE